MIALAACRVEPVEPEVARAIIRRHEHLRTSGNRPRCR
jgi:hypothetical protein